MLVREAEDSLAERWAVESRSNKRSCVQAGKTVRRKACARGRHAVIQSLQGEIGEGAEGWSGKFFCHHGSIPSPGPSALRLLLCVWGARPALLTCFPFLIYSAACVLHVAPASFPQTAVLRLCEKGSESAGSHHLLKTVPSSSHVSFVKM